MSLQFFSKNALATSPSATFLNVLGRELSFGEQKKRSAALSTWFDTQSVAVGQVVLVAVADELERASLLLAMISVGRPPLILDPDSTAYEIEKLLSECEYGAVIAEPELRQRWLLSDTAIPSLDVLKPKKKGGIFGKLVAKRAQENDSLAWPELPVPTTHFLLSSGVDSTVNGSMVAYVVYTSGTTSTPKGVEVCYSALISQLETLKSQYQLDKSSKILNSLPLHHVDGLIQGPLLGWFSGAAVIRPCNFSVQNLQLYLDSLYRYRISHFIAVPTMLSIIHRIGREWGENFESDDLQFVVSCAGHLERSLWEAFEGEFKVRVVNMYGLSETGTSALFSGPDEHSRKVGTLGHPINTRIRIVDDNDRDVTKGDTGELLISSNQLMNGYYKNPEATAKVLEQGWLRTGDLVCELASGHIDLVGRKKSQIIFGGRNISPEEISEILNSHKSVSESVVLGYPDEDWGEVVLVLVVLQDSGTIENELIEWCRVHLAEYKIPRRIYFVDRLAKGPSGKIRIEMAREQLEEQVLSSEVSLGSSLVVSQRIFDIAAIIFKINPSDLSQYSRPDNTPGWDSLAHMSFVVGLEKSFNIRLSTTDIMSIDSINSAIEICREKVEL
jgi:long-chain acyl-CoA synthetase